MTSGSPVITKCELKNSTHNEHHQDLKSWTNYRYKGTMKPCGQTPCQHNGTCQTGFTDKGYRCLCPPEYKGTNCEKRNGIDECSTGIYVCDINANCTNTDDSYICACKEGYTGDGHSCQG
ncbi:unnamed protein product, partial [Pocillopora meandrina]